MGLKPWKGSHEEVFRQWRPDFDYGEAGVLQGHVEGHRGDIEALGHNIRAAIKSSTEVTTGTMAPAMEQQAQKACRIWRGHDGCSVSGGGLCSTIGPSMAEINSTDAYASAGNSVQARARSAYPEPVIAARLATAVKSDGDQ